MRATWHNATPKALDTKGGPPSQVMGARILTHGSAGRKDQGRGDGYTMSMASPKLKKRYFSAIAAW